LTPINDYPTPHTAHYSLSPPPRTRTDVEHRSMRTAPSQLGGLRSQLGGVCSTSLLSLY
jgi:hypothetical protein